MVLVLVVAVLAAAAGVLARDGRLSRIRLRAVRLLVVAGAVQLLTSWAAPGSGLARATALVLTTVLVGLFLVGNARLPGVPLITLGLLLNVAVVTANHAMPVSVSSAARAGIARADLHLARDAMRVPTGPGTRYPLLADVVPVALPARPQVVSPGDVLVAAGVGLLILAAGVRRRRPPRVAQTPRRAVRSTVWARESTTVGSYS